MEKKRIEYLKYRDLFDEYTHLYDKKYAKELKPIEVTLEEIAEWKKVSKEQIIIKQ